VPVTVLSTTNLTEEQLQRLASISPRLQVRQVFCRSSAQVGPLLPGVEVLLTQHGDFSLEQADRLRWVQSTMAGVDQFLGSPMMRSPEIVVTTSSGIHATPIAEFVLGAMISLARKFPRAWHLQEEHIWPEHTWRELRGEDLRGKTVGILGYGSIGREIARLAQALGMRVVALSASGRRRDEGFCFPGVGDPEGRIPQAWYRPEQLAAFLGEADFVVISVPLTPKTRGMIDLQALRAMKRGAFLINVARGEVLQEEALLIALREGWLAGAALDVFAQEPLPPDHPLYRMGNVLLTPHISAATRNYNERLTELFAENLRRYLRGEPLWNVFDKERGY